MSDINRRALAVAKRAAKEVADVWVTEDSPRVVASRYWLTTGDELGPLFEWWNLRVEPGHYVFNGRFSRGVLEVPQVARLVPTTRSPGAHLLRVEGHPVTMDLFGQPHAVLLHEGETPEALRCSYLDLLAPSWKFTDDELFQAGPLKPVEVWKDDEFRGLVMPARLK